MAQSNLTKTTAQWDVYVSRINTQLPAAPPGLLDFYVAWAPWLAIVFGVLGLLASLAVLGVGALLTPFLLLGGAAGIKAGGLAFISALVGLATSALGVAGGYLMLNRRASGWWLLAVGFVLELAINLVGISLVGLVLTLLIAYVHLQVRPRYS